jgi:phosphoribosyl-ATP pyrophosphohydrolase / phosphoribosyl-AMP cyclohydrolase / histidinol dehydrogenase
VTTLPVSTTLFVSLIHFQNPSNLLTLRLATYGYAKQYSGVNLASFQKHITSSNLSAEGIKNVGNAVMRLAKVEELEAHRRAVEIRLEYLARTA